LGGREVFKVSNSTFNSKLFNNGLFVLAPLGVLLYEGVESTRVCNMKCGLGSDKAEPPDAHVDHLIVPPKSFGKVVQCLVVAWPVAWIVVSRHFVHAVVLTVQPTKLVAGTSVALALRPSTGREALFASTNVSLNLRSDS